MAKPHSYTVRFEEIRKIHPGVVSHVSCHEISAERAVPLHDHDFFEIQCGVEHEAVQTLNGATGRFAAGDFFLLRPEDTHEIHCRANRRFVYYNIGFERERLEFLDRNYGLEITGRYLRDPDWPRQRQLSEAQLHYVRNAIRDLFDYKNRVMVLDRFLLNLFFELEKEYLSPFQSCPEWLQETVRRLDSPERLRQGPRALAALSGYSLEYVGRTLKQCTGMTAGEVVNLVRMERASAMLALGVADLYRIADECGFSSMSYFFMLFKRKFGCTPRAYRLRHRMAVPGR